ncbi:MAG: adenosylmethionine decarboxylase [Candidatus Bathyarchaeota archaeon]|nr:MAG: adenosylmethionine decarboxylase [Candidatus Bathyarchaeota archaeon]
MLKISQLLIDLYGCQADLDDEDLLISALEAAAERVGAKIVRRITQRFQPVGVSVILILSETHLSIHTWPERGYAALDIFICGEGKDPEAAWGVIQERLEPSSFKANQLDRVIGGRRA